MRRQGSLSTSSRTAAAERVERGLLVGGQLDLEDPLHAARAEDDRDADEQAVGAELALEQDGARQDALAIEQDRHRPSRRSSGRGVERRAGLEQGDDLRAAVGRPLARGPATRSGEQQLGDRDAGDGRVARQRDHRVAVAAEDEGVGVLDRHAELLGDERPEAGGVEDAGHAQDALAREARGLQRHVAHRVERVGDDDQDRIGRVRRRLLDDGPDDPGVLGQQVVAAHARLAREPGGDDDDVGAGGVGVVVRAGDPGVVADDRGGLGEVEALALRQALDDVDEDDVGEAGLGDALRGRRADVAGADDGDLVAGHAAPAHLRSGRTLGTSAGRAGRPGRRSRTAGARRRRRRPRSWRGTCARASRLPVVGVRVRPRVARSRNSAGTPGHGGRHRQPEDRVDRRVGDVVERAVEGRPDHRPGVGDVHPLADAVRPAGPARVHEPDGHVVPLEALARASPRTRPGGAA